jgi:acyl-coenzyme A synthetase/AMP-(fatty) acid ligase
MPRFQEHDFAHFIQQYRITSIPIVPPIAHRLFGAKHSSHDFSSLEDIICAGAPMSAATQIRFGKGLPSTTRFNQLYGMSELGWITAFRSPDQGKPGSVGRLLPGVELK